MSRSMYVTAIVVVLFLSAAPSPSGAAVELETGRHAEVTEDGLHRVARSAISVAAWVKPDLTLAHYDKLLARPTGVSFRPVEARESSVRAAEVRALFPVSDKMKVRVRTAFREAFLEELSKVKGYEVTQSAGADVLSVQAFLVDVDAHFPTEQDNRWSTSYNRTWGATVVLELRDSATGTILARTVEREEVRPQEGVQMAAMWPHTQNLLDRWAGLACERLEELVKLAAD